jgi:predicted phosphoribosyltransferase
MRVVFRDRAEAGAALASILTRFARRDDVVVLALPRGGVPVGYEVASRLEAPLDVFLVRKLGVPGREELAMGAIASGGVRVLNERLVRAYGISDAAVERIAEAERQELERRERAYREGRPQPEVSGKVAILVDDGLATGSTMRAAVAAVRRLGPGRVVVAVPTAPSSTCEELAREADEVVCVSTPPRFRAVGLSYREFPQVSDEQVRDLLRRPRRPGGDEPVRSGDEDRASRAAGRLSPS